VNEKHGIFCSCFKEFIEWLLVYWWKWYNEGNHRRDSNTIWSSLL